MLIQLGLLQGLDMGKTTAPGDEKALQSDTSAGDTSGCCTEQYGGEISRTQVRELLSGKQITLTKCCFRWLKEISPSSLLVWNNGSGVGVKMRI